mmetsp:Transcript_125535/g.349462  ORF Transcript_125535/g.349462 Transcript_125535/m.349462 type:complete len:206 (-) Transcript_125535:1111-1728(-)
MARSLASSPSTQSRRSSLKAPSKTRAVVCCCFSPLAISVMEAMVFSHCLATSPLRNAQVLVLPSATAGKDCTVSRKPRRESSKSFWSCISRKRLRDSSCMALTCRFCSSMALLSSSSWALLREAFSSQLLWTIFCISSSWLVYLAFISSLSSSAIGPPPPPPPPPPEEAPANFFFNSSISAFKREICEASSFFVAWILIDLARLA